jgi:galactan endo-1,6-beta-galactosidase
VTTSRLVELEEVPGSGSRVEHARELGTRSAVSKERIMRTRVLGLVGIDRLIVLVLAPLVLLTPARAKADYTARIDPTASGPVWEGWGTSLAWWAHAFGDRDDIADILFTSRTTAYGSTTLPGLALNIVRYNAGASSATAIGTDVMQTSPNIVPFKQIEGYWLDWLSSDPSSASWNWYADSAQRNMMWKARDRGVDHFELFSNSPMWWMLYNHNPSGAADGGNNLQSWNEAQHALYLATVARYAHDQWGIDFTSVEPLNEPSGGWWKAGGTQEGCHVDTATQARVITALRAKLDEKGLGGMAVAASDENTYDDASRTWASFSNATRGRIGRVNVHGYQYGGGRRDRLHAAVSGAGKSLWNSEYGEDDATGMSLASNLDLDMRWLHPSAWVYWQALDYGGWGLIQADGHTRWLGPVNPKYFVLAQFTRHIRPGMRIMDGGEPNTVAAYDADAHKLVIVTTNYGKAQWITFDLSAFHGVTGLGGLVRRWATQTGGGDRYTGHEDTTLHGTTFWSWFDANTVQTFEIENVYL